jgi:hypothetical protein
LNDFDLSLGIAGCLNCRALVLVISFRDGRAELLDPSLLARHEIENSLGEATFRDWLDQGQGWGLGRNGSHECRGWPWPIGRADVRELQRLVADQNAAIDRLKAVRSDMLFSHGWSEEEDDSYDPRGGHPGY